MSIESLRQYVAKRVFGMDIAPEPLVQHRALVLPPDMDWPGDIMREGCVLRIEQSNLGSGIFNMIVVEPGTAPASAASPDSSGPEPEQE